MLSGVSIIPDHFYLCMRTTLFEKKTAADAGYLAVTYADGGTEKWFITEPAFSDGGIVQAPNTLVKGDGVAKPKTCTV